MKIFDLNVILYAANRSAKHHRTALAHWEAAMRSDAPVGLAWTVILGFLRLTTRPSVFRNPLTPEEAVQRVRRWLANPNVRIVGELEGHFEILAKLLAETGTGGNLTTDAHLAAIALSRGAILVSFDTDFARFHGLRWVNPLREDPSDGALKAGNAD